MSETRQYIILIALALMVTVAAAFAHDEQSVRLPLPRQLSGGTLPQFFVRDGSGVNVVQRPHLEKMIAPETKRVVFMYFATWCLSCAKGAMIVKNSGEMLRENGVQVFFINVGERDVDMVKTWIERHADPDLHLILDSRSQMVRAFGLLEPSGTIIMPKALVLDSKLKPLFLLGAKGNDFPRILWELDP